jgi:PEP-CTERM motif
MNPLVLAAAIAGLTLPASASVVLDFEGPLPDGLVPTSFIQGAPVPVSARVTDQYMPLGIRIADAALVQLGVGHAASGANGLAGISASGDIDYDQAVTFSFYLPGDGSTAGTTDFFAYSPDWGGGSGNVITISAFGLDGELVGMVHFTESGTFASPLAISGMGQFHKVTVDQTLYDRTSGGIGLDLVQIGDIAVAVPEPATLALVGVAVLGVARTRRRRPAEM